MTQAIERRASDLHLNPGRPPVARIDGSLVSLAADPLSDSECEALCRELCDQAQWAEVEAKGPTCDWGAEGSGDENRKNTMPVHT